jgi:hypothetical protein
MHAVHENESMNERLATVLVSRLTVIKSEEKAGLETVVEVQKSLKDKFLEHDQDQFVLHLERGSSCLTDSDGSLIWRMQIRPATWGRVRIVSTTNMSRRWNVCFKGFRR